MKMKQSEILKNVWRLEDGKQNWWKKFKRYLWFDKTDNESHKIDEGKKFNCWVKIFSFILWINSTFFLVQSFFTINVTVLKSFKINCCFFESYIISEDYVHFA